MAGPIGNNSHSKPSRKPQTNTALNHEIGCGVVAWLKGFGAENAKAPESRLLRAQFF